MIFVNFLVIFLTLGKKNKRLGLEDAVKRANRDLEKLANPKVTALTCCCCDTEILWHDNFNNNCHSNANSGGNREE